MTEDTQTGITLNTSPQVKIVLPSGNEHEFAWQDMIEGRFPQIEGQPDAPDKVLDVDIINWSLEHMDIDPASITARLEVSHTSAGNILIMEDPQFGDDNTKDE